MIPTAPRLPHEDARLARLRELVVLDTDPEPLFDSIARMASDICAAPIALLSLVDAERQWFKSNIGLPGIDETPRDIAFCAHAIASDELMEVRDTAADARFTDNPLVTGAPAIGFYAGAPLVVPTGERVGTLCVLDRRPRELDAVQQRALRSLAAIASQALVMRRELIDRSLSARNDYEQALARSEAQYRALVEEQVEMVSLAEPDGKLVYVNPAYARHFDRTPARMKGANLFDFISPPDRFAVRTRIEAVLADGIVRRGENQMIAADGSQRWVSWMNSVQRDAQGRPLLHSVGRDVTERKRLEQRLADSERFVRHVTDNLPVRIAYVDAQRRYRFANRAHCESLARSREEIIGRTRSELASPGPHDALIARRIDAALAGAKQHFEYEEIESGMPRLIEGRLIPDQADGGEVRGYFSINIDITERAAAERELRELTAIFDNTTDYVVQTDRRGNISYINPSARHALGLAPDTPIPERNFAEFNTPETNRFFMEVIVPALESGSTVWLGENTVCVAQGRIVPVSQMVIAHRDVEGRIVRYSSVMRDVSAAILAERETFRQIATLRSVTEAIPSCVAVFGADSRYRFVNGAFQRWCGMPASRIIGRRPVEIFGQQEFERRRPWLEKALAGQTVGFELEYAGQPATWLSIGYIPLRLKEDVIDGIVVVMQDVTRQKLEERRLLQLSHRDALTGILNRAGFEHALHNAWADDSGSGSLAILYIDLDHFKPLNDRYGHPAGDQALQMFAQRLRGLVRPTDLVARLGGDEFVVALLGMPENAGAQRVAEKITVAASEPFEIGSALVQLGASVGVAFSAGREIYWQQLIELADAQLLRAKASGRGRHSAHSPL